MSSTREDDHAQVVGAAFCLGRLRSGGGTKSWHRQCGVSRRDDQDRRAQRSVWPLRRYRRHRLGLDGAQGGRGFRCHRQRYEGRDHWRRSPEQARHRLEHCAPVVRRRQGDAIADVPTSSVALAINELTREKNKVFLAVGPATSDLTGKACSPNTVHWIYDTWALANGTGNAIVKRGGDTWFFLTADYA